MSSLHPEHYCLGGTTYIPCSWYLTFTIISLWILISAISCCFCCWTVQPRVSTIINSWCSLDHWQNMKWGCYCYKVWEFLNSMKPCVSMFYYVEHSICFTFIAACTSHSLYLVWQYCPVILIMFFQWLDLHWSCRYTVYLLDFCPWGTIIFLAAVQALPGQCLPVMKMEINTKGI